MHDHGFGKAMVGPASARYFLCSLPPGSVPVSVVSVGEGSAVMGNRGEQSLALFLWGWLGEEAAQGRKEPRGARYQQVPGPWGLAGRTVLGKPLPSLGLRQREKPLTDCADHRLRSAVAVTPKQRLAGLAQGMGSPAGE